MTTFYIYGSMIVGICTINIYLRFLDMTWRPDILTILNMRRSILLVRNPKKEQNKDEIVQVLVLVLQQLFQMAEAVVVGSSKAESVLKTIIFSSLGSTAPIVLYHYIVIHYTRSEQIFCSKTLWDSCSKLRKIYVYKACIFGVTSLKVTSLRVTGLL